jgi:hypothetical protein
LDPAYEAGLKSKTRLTASLPGKLRIQTKHARVHVRRRRLPAGRVRHERRVECERHVVVEQVGRSLLGARCSCWRAWKPTDSDPIGQIEYDVQASFLGIDYVTPGVFNIFLSSSSLASVRLCSASCKTVLSAIRLMSVLLYDCRACTSPPRLQCKGGSSLDASCHSNRSSLGERISAKHRGETRAQGHPGQLHRLDRPAVATVRILRPRRGPRQRRDLADRGTLCVEFHGGRVRRNRRQPAARDRLLRPVPGQVAPVALKTTVETFCDASYRVPTNEPSSSCSSSRTGWRPVCPQTTSEAIAPFCSRIRW